MGSREWTTLSDSFKMDVKWFLHFATASNGIRIIKPPAMIYIIECDSSLEAGGGLAGKRCYSWKYTKEILDRYRSIHELEALNLVIAYKTFAPYCDINSTVTIFTDNQASSWSIKTGKTKDKTLGACAREIWLAAALNQHDVDIRHKPGLDNPIPDTLSRMYSDPVKAKFVDKCILDCNLSVIQPHIADLKFFDACV